MSLLRKLFIIRILITCPIIDRKYKNQQQKLLQKRSDTSTKAEQYTRVSPFHQNSLKKKPVALRAREGRFYKGTNHLPETRVSWKPLYFGHIFTESTYMQTWSTRWMDRRSMARNTRCLVWFLFFLLLLFCLFYNEGSSSETTAWGKVFEIPTAIKWNRIRRERRKITTQAAWGGVLPS